MHDVLLVGYDEDITWVRPGYDVVLLKKLLMIEQLFALSASFFAHRPAMMPMQKNAPCELHDDTTSRRFTLVAAAFTGFLLAGCGTPPKLTSEQLAAMGVRDGVVYWDAEQKLAQAGYQCHVSGARRERFDFTKQTGVFPTCIFRIAFEADDQNRVSQLRIADPACMGTP